MGAATIFNGDRLGAQLLMGRACVKREYLDGLQTGRNEAVALLIHRSLDAVKQSFLAIIQSDSVYIPHKAHPRWGQDWRCPECAQVSGGWKDWGHFVGGCPQAGPRE